ncbi:MAG: DUF1156 domain-containing protein, partial [Planktothrix sp.]
LAEFFPSLEGETVQNYLWAHTVVCPSCQSVVPLSPNWWLYKRPEKQNLNKWCAAKPIPNPEKKRVDFELVKGSKGKGTTIQTDEGEYDPNTLSTLSRAVGKCCNCNAVITEPEIKSYTSIHGFGHQLYAVVYKIGKSALQFRNPSQQDFQGIEKAQKYLQEIYHDLIIKDLIPNEATSKDLHNSPGNYDYGLRKYQDLFNPRQLLTIVTYVEIINQAKALLSGEYEGEKVEAISTYLALVLDRCVDRNCRLSIWHTARASVERASTQHALNLTWNYPEFSGFGELWNACADAVVSDYKGLCALFGTKPHSIGLPGIEEYNPKTIQINAASADSLFHIPENSVDAIVTDPPYYATIPYADLSDFFYVWMKRTLGDIFPDLFWSEVTEKSREAVANPFRFRNMGASPDELAAQDYEAKM